MPLDAPRMSSRLSLMKPARCLAWTILSMSMIVVFVGTVMPQPGIVWVRVHVPAFASFWDWIDVLLPSLNPLHIILFAWVAGLSKLLNPRWSYWSILLIGSAFGGVSEALQMLAPGRDPRISDVFNDVAGILLGLALAAIVERVRRRSRD